MKETKRFFDNNRLNKGYEKTSIRRTDSDFGVIKKQYKHIMPPIEVVAEYEEINPGTLSKLLQMAGKEQEHRHSLDLSVMERYEKAEKSGRFFALIFIAFVCITTVILTIMGSPLNATLFSLAAFLCVAAVSLLYSNMFSDKVKDKIKHRIESSKMHPHRRRAVEKP